MDVVHLDWQGLPADEGYIWLNIVEVVKAQVMGCHKLRLIMRPKKEKGVQVSRPTLFFWA